VLIIPSRLIATCFALICFAAAIVVGVSAGNSALTVLWRALLVMGGAWLVGQAVGAIVQHTLNQHVESYREQHPLPGQERNSDSEENVAAESEPSRAE